MPGKWWVGGPFILLASSIGLAQIHVAPPVMPLMPHAACALKVSGECALKALHRSFEVILDAGHTVVMVLGTQAKDNKALESTHVKVAADLESSRLKGEMTAEEASTVAADFAKLEGVQYQIPELEKLKGDLGFAKDSSVELEDLRDLVRTHLQLTFGMKPLTAKYLTDHMGLETAGSFEARVAELLAEHGLAVKPNRN